MRKKLHNIIFFIYDLAVFLHEISIPVLRTLSLVFVLQIPTLITALIVILFAGPKEVLYLVAIFLAGGIIITLVFDADKEVALTFQRKFSDFFIHPKRNHFYLIRANGPNANDKDFYLIKMLADKRYMILTDNEVIVDKKWAGDEVLLREIKEKEEIDSIKVLNELL